MNDLQRQLPRWITMPPTLFLSWGGHTFDLLYCDRWGCALPLLILTFLATDSVTTMWCWVWQCLPWDLCYHTSVTLSFYGKLAGAVISTADPMQAGQLHQGSQSWMLVETLSVMRSWRTLVTDHMMYGKSVRTSLQKALWWQLLQYHQELCTFNPWKGKEKQEKGILICDRYL